MMLKVSPQVRVSIRDLGMLKQMFNYSTKVQPSDASVSRVFITFRLRLIFQSVSLFSH